MRRQTLRRFLLLSLLASSISTAGAYAQAVSSPVDVPSDPIRCWWKTDKSSVHVGEQFTVTLTCATIDTPGTRVAADAAALDPSAVQLTPYEVVNGARHNDLVDPPWRYLQYDYRVRLIGDDDLFGQDVPVPAFTVPYTVQVTSGGTVQEGREQTYVLPPLPVRISSLVPNGATDIRDASRDSFSVIEQREQRAVIALVAGGIALAFAVALLALAAAQAWRARRTAAAVAAPVLPEPAVLHECVDVLARVRTDAVHSGWSRELAERALAPLRIASAVALAHPFSQVAPADGHVEPRSGEMLVTRGRLRRKTMVVSARVTPEMIARRLKDVNGSSPQPLRRDDLRTLGESLQVFTATRYGRPTEPDPTALQRALEEGVTAVRRLRQATSWPARAIRALGRSVPAGGSGAWRS